MACYHPVRVAIKRKNSPSSSEALRVRDMAQVPCGHCLGCRAQQRWQWAVRLTHEAQVHPYAWFATLTYDDEYMPHDGTLNPEHPRSFIKSLRKSLPPGKLSYFLCGEYGETTKRPHYHALLYGPDFLDRRRLDDRDGSPVWRSDAMESYHWGRGLTEFSAVTFASAAYTAGYVQKKVDILDNPHYLDRLDPSTGEIKTLHPEFSRMSTDPAIGSRWLRKHWRDVYPRDYVVIDGTKCKPPRYYDKWADQEHDDDLTCDCEAHREALYEAKMNRWDPDQDDSKQTRLNREANHKARIALYKTPEIF